MSTAITADVAVVGAGPAGMAAALAAADLGCRVVLVDAGAAMGGQIYRAPASGRAAAGRRAEAPGMPRRLRRAAAHPGIHHLPGTTVWHATAPDRTPGTSGESGAGGETGAGRETGAGGETGAGRETGASGDRAGRGRRRGDRGRRGRVRAVAGRRGGAGGGRERGP